MATKLKTEEQYFSYLDELKAAGVVNMFGAADYIQDAFDLDKHEAKKVVLAWVKQYK